MYYRDFDRIKRMERLLERLAYASVALDFFVAIATFLVIKGAEYSSFMLMISGYLMLAEVAIASLIFAALLGMRYYEKIIESIASASFKTRYIKEISAKPKSKNILVLILRKLIPIPS